MEMKVPMGIMARKQSIIALTVIVILLVSLPLARRFMFAKDIPRGRSLVICQSDIGNPDA
jgi:hypothetical protein